uniref:Uncharacterized protein n=1 Tax=Arundo donax TaxID=35708 RepID=A0A0A9FXC5_ARUDO
MLMLLRMLLMLPHLSAHILSPYLRRPATNMEMDASRSKVPLLAMYLYIT